MGGAVGGGVGNHVICGNFGLVQASVRAAGAGVVQNAKGGSSNSTTSSAIGAGIGSVIGKSILVVILVLRLAAHISIGGGGAAIQRRKISFLSD